jgi:predicted small lipoprotein YifL
MKRALLLVLMLAFALAACGGSGDTTVPPPPNSSAYQAGSNQKIDAIISGWQRSVPEEMKAQGAKPETIEQATYVTTASLAEIQHFYQQLTSKGWTASRRAPGLDATQGVLLLGFQHGTTGLAVGALDAGKFGGSGTIIYTCKGAS